MSHKQAGMLIATLFLARDLTHREHLKVTGPGSFAKHDALAKFYEAIVGLADTLAEAYQGCFDVVLDIPLASQDGDLSIIDTLGGQLDYIHDVRHEAIPRDWSALHNIVDEVETLYMQTLYRLRKLQ